MLRGGGGRAEGGLACARHGHSPGLRRAAAVFPLSLLLEVAVVVVVVGDDEEGGEEQQQQEEEEEQERSGCC